MAKKKDELSLKHKLFVENYIIHNFNATRAYRETYPKVKNDAVAGVNGHNLLKKPKIQVAVSKRMAEAAKNVEITPEKVLTDLEHTRLAALGAKQYTAAKGCSELQGKYLAMFTDKQLVEGVADRLEKMTDEELRAEIVRLQGEIGKHEPEVVKQ